MSSQIKIHSILLFTHMLEHFDNIKEEEDKTYINNMKLKLYLSFRMLFAGLFLSINAFFPNIFKYKGINIIKNTSHYLELNK